MKKIVANILVVVVLMSCFSMVASAKVGDKIGQALHTDIVAYINHYAIPSYAVNGQSVIVAEDLRNFGFDVTWNANSRSLSIARNGNTWVTPMNVTKQGATGSKFTDILATDIKVYAGGRRITSYAMNGYTMIPVEELTMFGEVYWVQNERALKLWVNGLQISSTKQKVSQYVAPQPTYNASAIYMYVVNCNESISLRTSPSTSAYAAKQIPLGATVEYLGDAGNGFYKVRYNGTTGYALASYLIYFSEENQNVAAQWARVVNCKQSITLRTVPSTSGSEIMQIPLGEYVTYLGSVQNGFAYVEYAGRYGYVLESYLRIVG